MSKGSALVSILFAFFVGVVVGNTTSSGGGETEVAAADANAESDVKAIEEADGPDRYGY